MKLDELNSEIYRLTQEVYKLGRIIESCYVVIKSLEDPDQTKIYAKETMPFIDDYNALYGELKKALESYFAKEKENGLPLNFSYRKLYKLLKKY